MVATGGCILIYAASLALLGVLGSGDLADAEFARVPLVISSIITGLVYITGLWSFRRQARILRRGLLAILLVGLAARCVILVSPPFLETDYHRYLLDGAMTAHGLNPYDTIPDRLLADESTGSLDSEVLAEIASAGRETIEQMHQTDLATIYPPLTQAVFATAYFIQPWSAYVLRVVLLAFDIATVGLLLMLLQTLKLPPGWIAWYWWNPVLLREVTSSAHMDVIAFPFVIGAVLLALRGRAVCCSIALVLAVATKLWPILLAPVLLRTCVRRIPTLLGTLAILVAGSALTLWPMVTAAAGDDAGLHAFSRYWRNNEGFFALWSYAASVVLPRFSITGDDVIRYTRLGVAIFVGCWAAFWAFKPVLDGQDLVARVLRVVAALFLLAPTQFPWYYLWMLPLLCARQNFALMLYSVTLPLYYLHTEYRSVLWIEHLPIWAVLVGVWLWSRKRSHASFDAPTT